MSLGSGTCLVGVSLGIFFCFGWFWGLESPRVRRFFWGPGCVGLGWTVRVWLWPRSIPAFLGLGLLSRPSKARRGQFLFSGGQESSSLDHGY